MRRLTIERVYDDGGRRAHEYRVLIDRLWPRGRTRESVDCDEWAAVVAPSTPLRQWYAHDVTRFDEFVERYRDELAVGVAAQSVARLRTLRARRGLVLLTASRDIAHSHASVLRDVLATPSR